MRYIFSILVIISLALSSCKDEVVAPSVDMGYSYYPLKTGDWTIYRLDSISYDDFTNTIDTFALQVKEVIGDTFHDNAGRISYRIERYYRKTESDTWNFYGVWYVTPTRERIERVEENEKFLRLVFPVRVGLKWNGNAYNTHSPLEYVYTDVDGPHVLPDMSFDSCAFVLHQDDFSLISRDYSTEIYARNIGMVYKKNLSLELDQTGKIRKGFDYSYTITDFGR